MSWYLLRQLSEELLVGLFDSGVLDFGGLLLLGLLVVALAAEEVSVGSAVEVDTLAAGALLLVVLAGFHFDR